MQNTIVADTRGVLGWIVQCEDGIDAFTNDGNHLGTYTARESAIADILYSWGCDRYWAFDRAALN